MIPCPRVLLLWALRFGSLCLSLRSSLQRFSSKDRGGGRQARTGRARRERRDIADACDGFVEMQLRSGPPMALATERWEQRPDRETSWQARRNCKIMARKRRKGLTEGTPSCVTWTCCLPCWQNLQRRLPLSLTVGTNEQQRQPACSFGTRQRCFCFGIRVSVATERSGRCARALGAGH
jgi:hypothetical protein